MSKLTLKRKKIVIAFLFATIVQVLFIGFLGEQADKAKKYSIALNINMHNLEDNLINKALMLQTNELDYIVETWHNIYMKNYDSGLKEVFDYFTNNILVSKIGIDGERIIAVLNNNEEFLYASKKTKDFIKESNSMDLICPNSNTLYPNYHYTEFNNDIIYWNKVVLPTPSSETDKLVIIYGFSKNKFLNSLNNNIHSSIYEADSLAIINSRIFWILSLIMFITILIGMFISISLRQAEEEVENFKKREAIKNEY